MSERVECIRRAQQVGAERRVALVEERHHLRGKWESGEQQEETGKWG